MIERKEFNQPFCVSLLVAVFLFVSFGCQLASMILQIINNQFSIFSMSNSLYLQGMTDISSYCGTLGLTTAMNYYCFKYKNHISFLTMANALVILTVAILFFSLIFAIILTINVKKKTHSCISQKKSQKVILTLSSFGMVMSCSLLGYYISFYVNFDSLTGLSNNVATYRTSFFIGVVTSCAGTVFMLISYIMTFAVKTIKKTHPEKYKAANNTQMPTLMNTLGDMNQQEMQKAMQQQMVVNNNNQDQPVVDFRDFYRKNKKNEPPPKPEVKIQEVEPINQLNEQQGKDRRLNGITRYRPKLPTLNPERSNGYPKLQRPRIIPRQLMKNKAQVDQILNPLKAGQRRLKGDGQMQINHSTLKDEERDSEENIENMNSENKDKENNSENSNGDIALNRNKDKQVQLVSIRRNTNAASQQEMSQMDPTHLHIFQRKMHVGQHLRLMQRKQRR